MKRLTKPLLKNVSTFFGELHYGVATDMDEDGDRNAKILKKLGVALFLLETNGQMPVTQLEAIFKKRYQFIENQKSIHNLAILVKNKADRTDAVEGKKFISLSRREIEDKVLAPLDLTGKEDLAESMIKELE